MHRIRLTLSAALAIAALLAAPRAARANDCTSMTPVLGQVWNEFKSAAASAGCAVVSKVVDYESCLDVADKVVKIDSLLVKAWNEVAANGPASIGPRVITMNEVATGNLVGTSERVFYSARAATKKPVNVRITKVSGSEDVKLTVCTADENMKCTMQQTGEFKSDAKDGKEIVKTLKNVKGKVIVVHLAAARLNFKHLAYKLTIEN